MSTRTLPSDSDFMECKNDKIQCRSLVLQALSYGTNYDVWPRKDDDDDDIVQKSHETAAVLQKTMPTNPEMESILVDCFWLVSSIVHPNERSYQSLVYIIKHVSAQSPSLMQKLQATLDPELLEATHVLPQGGKEFLMKRLRKLNTDMWYRQQKYNLLQEESEGYAKLLTLLVSLCNGTAVATNQQQLLSSSISECMAAFDLDPNRVLDLILDVIESQVAKEGSSNNTMDSLLSLMKDFCLPKVPHLIGFKLTNYQNSKKAPPPPSLYETIVLLTKANLLQLDDLLPHLPPVSQLGESYKTFTSLEKQRIQSMGRVRLAGGAGDAANQAARDKKIQEARASVAKDARVGLALVFLQKREWKLALQVLEGTCQQVVTLLPNLVGKSICDYVQETIEPVYKALVHPPCLNGSKGKQEQEPIKKEEEKDATTALTATSSLEQVTEAIAEPLHCISESGCIESHPILYCQLCRLLGTLLKKTDTTAIGATFGLFQSFLVPSLSLFPPNPAISAELWSVLELLPYSKRYSLYRNWSLGDKPLCLLNSEAQAGKAARYALKRLSKDNVRDMGRQVSKVTHSNPLVVFTTILGQIESYDNLIELMVETVRFVTPLSLDVLGYCVLSRLTGSSSSNSDANRSRLKGDGVNVSQWLASLESFAGAFYKKCPDVECRGILCYLIRRLKEGSVVELGVLRTLLNTAGGYSFADYTSAASLSNVQLEGRSGSQLLKRETFAFGVVEKLNQQSSQRLRSVLQSDGMGVTVLILLAQVRSRVLFHQSGMQSKPIKLIGNLFDTCQVVMGLLLEFLTDSTEEEEPSGGNAIAKYAEFMPTLVELHEKYGLDPASAWMLCRPLIRTTMDDSQKKSGRNKLTKLDMTLRKFRPSEAATQKFLPESAWSHITPLLFDTFFSHAMYDVSCPESCYETEISRLSKEVERLTQHQKGGAGAAAQKSVLAATAASAGATEREIRRAMAFSKEDEAELDRVKHSVDVLSTDLATQKKHCELIREKINLNKNKLFPSDKISPSMAMTFLTHCIYPRCTLSPDDALFCAEFVFLLHELETPGFSTLHYLDELINAVAGALYCVSEGEAANMALLLWKTWDVVSRWRYDEDAYKNEVAGKPGSYMVEDDSSSAEEKSEESVSVTHDEYKSLYNKWHATIGQAALGCLDSLEYMHNRACLIVLTRIVNVYPTRPVLGQKLMDALAPLQEDSNPLQDIKAMAQSYCFQITKARDDGVWKEEDAAVTKARVEKEKAAVEERKKKAAKQLAEMKRENDKLADQLGDGRRRDDRRRPISRGAAPGSRIQSPLNVGAPVFEPPPKRQNVGNGDLGAEGGRRGRDEQRNRPRERERQDGVDERRGERGPHGAGLEGRWQRGGAQGPPPRENVSGVKRGRSPDRNGPGDSGARGSGARESDRDDRMSKRPRMDRDGGDRDGRAGSRGGSPIHRGFRSQRGPPPPPPPPSQQQHRDRGGTRSDRRGAPNRR